MEYSKKALAKVKSMLLVHDLALKLKESGDFAGFGKSATAWNHLFIDLKQSFGMDGIFKMQEMVRGY